MFFREIIVNIAQPVAPVNGQDERRKNAPPLTAAPVCADG